MTPPEDRPDDTSPLPEDLVVPDDLSSLLDGDVGTTDKPEAGDWADSISADTGQSRDVFYTYKCKLCPRSPATNKQYWHVGHRYTERAQASKTAERQGRIARQATARRAGMLVGQRVDPTILDKLRKIGKEC